MSKPPPRNFFAGLARLCGRVILTAWAALWALMLISLTVRNVRATSFAVEDALALGLILVPAALVFLAWRFERWGAWLLLLLACIALLSFGVSPRLAGVQYVPAIIGAVLIIGARYLEPAAPKAPPPPEQ